MMLPIIDAVIGTMKTCSEKDEDDDVEDNGNTKPSVSGSMTTIEENVSEMQLSEHAKESQVSAM
jgi:hypothetical protein